MAEGQSWEFMALSLGLNFAGFGDASGVDDMETAENRLQKSQSQLRIPTASYPILEPSPHSPHPKPGTLNRSSKVDVETQVVCLLTDDGKSNVMCPKTCKLEQRRGLEGAYCSNKIFNSMMYFLRPSSYPLLGPKYPLLGTIYPQLRVQGRSWFLEVSYRFRALQCLSWISDGKRKWLQ